MTKIIGKGVSIGENVTFTNIQGGEIDPFIIGDGVTIGDDCKFLVPSLEILDFSIIHNHALCSGYKPMRIGRNCWIGEHTILNSTGGLFIGDGVGVGAYSQLWTHIRHGDVMQGCRWNSNAPMIIHDDVWFVGHCIVGPITAHPMSMALVGSVVTGDMEENHVYGGVPAQDMTSKIGPQFTDIHLEQKYTVMLEALRGHNLEFNQLYPYVYVEYDGGVLCIDVQRRTYKKTRSPGERTILRTLLPDIKLIPTQVESTVDAIQNTAWLSDGENDV